MPNFYLMGDTTSNRNRMALFTFIIRNSQTGLYLHSRFTTKLLNDLFGIKAKTICACDGNYSIHLSGLDKNLATYYAHASAKLKLLEPCLTRLNLPFFFTQSQIDYILEALRFVAEHGWKFLVLYRFDMESGLWHHKYTQVSFFDSSNEMFQI